MPDFLPPTDLPLRAWLRLFRDAVSAEGATYGVDAGEAAAAAATGTGFTQPA